MYTTGLKEELTQNLALRVQEHKQRFIHLFIGRYKELLPSLIVYQGKEKTSIDFLKTEVALRSNYDVVIGKNTFDNLVVLGFCKNNQSSENPVYLFEGMPINKEDITFIVPHETIPEDLREISFIDDCQTGNFVVLRNKTLNYINDYEVIKHYTNELAEIVLSRYSIAMQSKLNTIFTSEVNDETINQLVTAIYNGAPYVKTSKMFDPLDNIIRIENEYMSSNFVELKREYQNKISELNNMLGINSLAVEKSSGVSDTEAKSNRSYTTSNANIYLAARNEPLKKLNKRFNLSIEAVYNDEVSSEFSDIAYSSNEGETNGNMDD